MAHINIVPIQLISNTKAMTYELKRTISFSIDVFDSNDVLNGFQVRVFGVWFRGARGSGQSFVPDVAGTNETGRLGRGSHQSVPQILPRRISG